MQVVILSARTGWHTEELCRALADRGHVGCVLPYEGLVAQLGPPNPRLPTPDSRLPTPDSRLSSEGSSLLDADAVLARIIPNGSLEQIIYRMDALHWIEERGIPVMNRPRTIEQCVDKFYTTARLQEAGLPVPATVVCERTDEAMAAIRAMLGGPSALLRAGGQPEGRTAQPALSGRVARRPDCGVIIKPIFGSMGHGLVRVSDPDVAFRIVRSLEQVRAVFYVQQAVDHGGRDVRVFVVGGRVLGAIERQAPAGEWRTNVSRGGLARPFDLPLAWEQLAVRAAAAVGADYAGVDLLPARDGAVFVLEVNGIPGWQGLQLATGIVVAGAIVDHLVMRLCTASAAAELPA